jgi:hypothetical protein
MMTAPQVLSLHTFSGFTSTSLGTSVSFHRTFVRIFLDDTPSDVQLFTRMGCEGSRAKLSEIVDR